MMELVTSQELMRALKVSKSTFFRMKKLGLPTVGGGKLARYDPARALEWFHLNSHLTRVHQKTSKAILEPGNYRCECGFEGTLHEAIDRSKVGACPQCGATKAPVRVR